MMVIGISGYGYSGAGAFRDLLMEFEGLQSVNLELQVIQEIDGITDLKRNLVQYPKRNSSHAAIYRFKHNIKARRNLCLIEKSNGRFIELSNKYIDELTCLTWNGYSIFDPVDCQMHMSIIRRILNKIHFKQASLPTRFFSILDEKKFDDITKSYLHDLLGSIGFTQDIVVVEQLFNTLNPTEGMEYFDDAFAIIVERDPRDLYVLTNHIYRDRTSFMPNSGDVKKFVKYYRFLQRDRSNDSRVLYIKYEDLIYDYQNTLDMLETKLGKIDINKGKYFKPELSFNNTQLFNKYPEYKDEISFIEEELPEYLYDFSKYKSLGFEPVEHDPFDNQEDIQV